MLKAVHRRDGQVVAESLGAVALPYPTEYLRTTPNYEPLDHAATVTRGQARVKPDQVFKSSGDSIKYSQDLWPWLLLFVASLLIFDIYFKRLRVFGYRTIKF